MLKFAIIKVDPDRNTSLAIARGEHLEVSEDILITKIKNLTMKILPAKRLFFKRRKWKDAEIRDAIESAIAGVSEELKRKTIRM